jgi:hypothetical protein
VNKGLRSGFQGPWRNSGESGVQERLPGAMEVPSQMNTGLRSGFQGAMEVPSHVNKGLRSGSQKAMEPWRHLVR